MTHDYILINIAATHTLSYRGIGATPSYAARSAQVKLPAFDSWGASRLYIALAHLSATVFSNSKISYLASMGTGVHLVAASSWIDISRACFLVTFLNTSVQLGFQEFIKVQGIGHGQCGQDH